MLALHCHGSGWLDDVEKWREIQNCGCFGFNTLQERRRAMMMMMMMMMTTMMMIMMNDNYDVDDSDVYA